MKEFKFDHASKSWDRYGAFYTTDWAIVEFETGEVMIRTSAKDYRQMYERYGIQVVASTDSSCPRLFLDKECTEPCPKAWLTQNGYTPLAIDHEQKVAFQLHHPTRRGQTGTQGLQQQNHLGRHIRDALGYWAGAGRMPIPNGKTEIQRPNPEWRNKVSPILTGEVIPAITAMHRMAESKRWYDDGKYQAKESWLDSSASEIIDDIVSNHENRHYSVEMTDDHRKDAFHKIATRGFSYPRSKSEVDFLYIKGEK